MSLSSDQHERLALHSAFAIHQHAQWAATRSDVPTEVRERLRGHMSAIEGVLVNSGHDWIQSEIEATENALNG